MTEDELRDKCTNLCFILGVMTCALQKDHSNIEWIYRAIDEVVYKNNPLPSVKGLK